MKFQPLALLAIFFTGVIASEVEGFDQRDLDIEERSAEFDIEERGIDIDLEDRDADDLTERDADDVEERDNYGGGGYCRKIQWVPGVCKKCPWVYGKGPRDEGSAILERGNYNNGGVCKKKCPKKHLRCEKEDWAPGYPKYKAYYATTFYCAKTCSYKVKAVIETGKSGKQYFNVYFDQPKWNKGYLGIFSKSTNIYSHKQLNFNQYCKGNKCSVPVDKLPGYPKLCGAKLYIAVYSNKCDEKKWWGKGGRKYGQDEIRYFPITIECYGKKTCVKHCCCP